MLLILVKKTNTDWSLGDLFGAKCLTPRRVTFAKGRALAPFHPSLFFFFYFWTSEATDRGKKEECVQFPAGLSEMGNMHRAPRCCKVTPAATYLSRMRLDWRWAFAGDAERNAYQPLTHSHTWRRMGILEADITSTVCSRRCNMGQRNIAAPSPLKRWIQSHLLFAGIISSPFSPR